MLEIRLANMEDIDLLTPLYDSYRVFYRKNSDPRACRAYLADRLTAREAVVFIAINGSQGVGFTLLYPSFSSVSMGRIFILNDLFVHLEFRKRNIGSALLETAIEYGRKNNALKLHLETEVSNINAQALYEKEGWIRESGVFHYDYTL